MVMVSGGWETRQLYLLTAQKPFKQELAICDDRPNRRPTFQ